MEYMRILRTLTGFLSEGWSLALFPSSRNESEPHAEYQATAIYRHFTGSVVKSLIDRPTITSNISVFLVIFFFVSLSISISISISISFSFRFLFCLIVILLEICVKGIRRNDRNFVAMQWRSYTCGKCNWKKCLLHKRSKFEVCFMQRRN